MRIKLKDVQNGLKRDQMRSIRGGCGTSGGKNKCCWKGTNNCSTCSNGTVCVSGAELKPC